jgi:hypothetical protein
MGEMVYEFFKEKISERGEYHGTEFRYPLLFGLTGAMEPTDEMTEGALSRRREDTSLMPCGSQSRWSQATRTTWTTLSRMTGSGLTA